MTRALVFVIPVRHPGSVPDWSIVRQDLARTLASIAAQTEADWECRVVANRGADLPPMPAQCEFRPVDLPLPVMPDRQADPEAYNDAVRHDKGLRLYEGIRDIAPDSYVMVVDFDDFVSRRLTGFVSRNRGKPGWYIDQGYLYAGAGWALKVFGFHQKCGTSHLVRRDLLGPLETAAGIDIDAIKRHLGSHIFLKSDLAAAGTPLEPLPFPGAVYRVGNPQSTSGTGAGGRFGLFWSHMNSRSPRHILRILFRHRPAAALRREFTLA